MNFITGNTLLLAVLLPATGLFAQQASLTGTVTDRATQKPLAGISIDLSPGTARTATDSLGNFLLSGLAPGTYSLQVTGVGYAPRSFPNTVLTSGNVQTLSVELERAAQELANVVVTGGRPSARATSLESPLSVQRLTTEEIRSNPGGNFDISRVIQSLPGVGGGSGGGSYRNDIIIRGGAPGENVFYLDGIEVPVINHFSTQGSGGGPQGILNVSFIEDVKLSTSAFDARYDNALSSVFQFKQKTGNPERLQGNFRLSGTEAAATFDGPLAKGTTFLASARRSYLKFLFQLLDLPIRPDYWDFQFKTTTRLDDRTTLSVLGIGAIDEFRFAAPKEATPEKLYTLNSNPLINQWTYTVGATLRRLTARGYWNLSLSRNTLNNGVDKYADNERPDASAQTLRIRSRETENKLRFDVTSNAAGWKWSWGLSAQAVQFDNSFLQVYRPEIRDAQGNVLQEQQVLTSNAGRDFLRYGAFVQAGRRIFAGRLAVSAGVRADANTLPNSEQNPLQQLSPRLGLSYALTDRWNLNASYGIYYRLPSYTQLAFTGPGGLLANPGRYIRGTHYVAGVEFLPSGNTRVTAEGFYKGYRHYPVSRNDGISIANKGTEFGAIGNEPVRQHGSGEAYGIELFAQQKLTKRFFGVVSYTLYRSLFTNADGRYAPASWDNRHLFSSTLGYKPGRNWELGLKFRYQGAAPFTPYDLEASRRNYGTLGTGVFDYARVNSRRLPAFHAADIRADKRWNFRRLTLDVFIDLQNFYGAENEGVPDYTFQRTADNSAFLSTDGQPVRGDGSNAVPLLLSDGSGRILPTIGIIVEF
ncbi:MAG: TonB-dependent receptor [Chitinophagaceae bacterium]|nr:MAG: TonB-dependent receptor [Chitinophagaceae bacterium]